MSTNVELSTTSARLTRDLRNAAKTMGASEARILVDMFETTQRDRIRNGNRVQALDKSDEPNSVLRHFFGIEESMEDQIAAALKKYVESVPLGQWMLDQTGVGPLIAARLLAFVDWDACDTPSRIWAFAGLVPGLVWEKGQKRPWNARLKRVCFLLGESFVKTQSRENAFYGAHFTRKKRELWNHNASGGNKERALVLKDGVGKATEAHRWYRGDVSAEAARMFANGTWPTGKKPWTEIEGAGLPMLPPAHIHAMARRWVVKLFLAHAWEVNWRMNPENEGKSFSPYAIIKLGHRDVIPPPGMN